MAIACEHAPRRNWKLMEIAAIIIVFLINPIAGLLVFLWRLWEHAGRPRDISPMVGKMRSWFDDIAESFRGGSFRGERTNGNSAFEEYKRETLERLERERQKLRDQEREFGEFMAELRRTRDKEEFDRFMSSRGQAT
jgi:hypothetical protein